MSLENSSTRQDIDESVRTNTIINVVSPGGISDFMSGVRKLEGVDAADYTVENDGTYDIWGTRYGGDFRLRLTV